MCSLGVIGRPAVEPVDRCVDDACAPANKSLGLLRIQGSPISPPKVIVAAEKSSGSKLAQLRERHPHASADSWARRAAPACDTWVLSFLSSASGAVRGGPRGPFPSALRQAPTPRAGLRRDRAERPRKGGSPGLQDQRHPPTASLSATSRGEEALTASALADAPQRRRAVTVDTRPTGHNTKAPQTAKTKCTPYSAEALGRWPKRHAR